MAQYPVTFMLVTSPPNGASCVLSGAVSEATSVLLPVGTARWAFHMNEGSGSAEMHEAGSEAMYVPRARSRLTALPGQSRDVSPAAGAVPGSPITTWTTPLAPFLSDTKLVQHDWVLVVMTQ